MTIQEYYKKLIKKHGKEKKDKIIDFLVKKFNLKNRNVLVKYLQSKNLFNESNFAQPARPVFGKKVVIDNKLLKEIYDEYERYIIWNGLKNRDKILKELANKYSLNYFTLVDALKKNNMYDIDIGYRERKF